MEVMDVDFGPAPVRLALRDYQERFRAAIREDRKTFSRLLVEAATGTGKTSLYAAISGDEVDGGGRVLVLENRDRLVRQTVDRITRETGIEAAIEMAGEHASPYAPVVVASVQTLCRDARLTGFADEHFSLVVADESHHALANSWQKVLRYFHYGAASLSEDWQPPPDGTYTPKAHILGVTATPELGANRNLGEFYQKISASYPYIQAVHDGWLVPPLTKNIPLQIDLRGLRPGRTPNGSDLKADELAERLVPVIEALAKQIAAEASDRKSIAFVPSIECARLLAAAVERHGLRGIFVSGECLDVDEKTEAFVRAGPGTVLTNAALYCLDKETEVLTDRGFVGFEDMSASHLVANWTPSGECFFSKPKQVVRRQLYPDEHMVSVSSRMVNFRVTNTHNMAIRCGAKRTNTKKVLAQDISNRLHIPTCGVAQPLPRFVIDEVKPSSRGRRISANAWTLRNRYGFDYESSISEATRREDVRSKLCYRQPSELSIDECRLIGFWIADGHKCKLSNGGTVHCLTQSTAYPYIIKWIDSLLERLGLYARKSFIPSNNGFQAWQWHLSRGTGGGTQERVGVYPLEPYFNKNGTDLFWGLSEAQFDALMEGYWYGDGFHGSAEHGFQWRIHFNETKKSWVELVCAIGPVRGWRCLMRKGSPPPKPHHSQQWAMTMMKGKDTCMSHRTNIVHEPFSKEEVWCVESDSGYIITRRHGKVIVTGNCEGADFPDISCVIPARATKSSGFYKQQVGRGTRVLPGVVDGLATAEERRAAIAASAKPNLLILDPLWISDRIDLCDAYDLFTDKPEVKERMKKSGPPSDESARQAERDLIKALEKEAKKHARKQARVINPLEWAVALGDAKLASWEPQAAWESSKPTPGQLDFLRRHHIDVSKIQFKGLAQKVIGIVLTRHKLGLATVGQLDFMHKLGIDDTRASVLSAGDAKSLIDATLAARRG